MTFYLFKQGLSGQEKEKSDQQQVKQSLQSLIVQEGEISILNCRRGVHLTLPMVQSIPWQRPCILDSHRFSYE